MELRLGSRMDNSTLLYMRTVESSANNNSKMCSSYLFDDVGYSLSANRSLMVALLRHVMRDSRRKTDATQPMEKIETRSVPCTAPKNLTFSKHNYCSRITIMVRNMQKIAE